MKPSKSVSVSEQFSRSPSAMALQPSVPILLSGIFQKVIVFKLQVQKVELLLHAIARFVSDVLTFRASPIALAPSLPISLLWSCLWVR